LKFSWLSVSLSRHATPYHAPLYLAQARGYFKDEGLKVALLEPNDPSDVTEIIGSGKVDMGFKAMIHTLAVRFLVDISTHHC
jgi:pyrimidine precursor biosynthesis enzyme